MQPSPATEPFHRVFDHVQRHEVIGSDGYQHVKIVVSADAAASWFGLDGVEVLALALVRVDVDVAVGRRVAQAEAFLDEFTDFRESKGNSGLVGIGPGAASEFIERRPRFLGRRRREIHQGVRAVHLDNRRVVLVRTHAKLRVRLGALTPSLFVVQTRTRVFLSHRLTPRRGSSRARVIHRHIHHLHDRPRAGRHLVRARGVRHSAGFAPPSPGSLRGDRGRDVVAGIVAAGTERTRAILASEPSPAPRALPRANPSHVPRHRALVLIPLELLDDVVRAG